MKSKIHKLIKKTDEESDSGLSRTKLDSHANMMVCNDDCHIFDSVYKRSTDVEPFDPSLGLSTKVPIVDVALNTMLSWYWIRLSPTSILINLRLRIGPIHHTEREVKTYKATFLNPED